MISINKRVFSVLIVEKDKEEQQRLKLFFEQEGFQVYSTSLFHHSLEIIAKYKPDLLVSEINIDGGDGIGLCYKIRESNAFNFLTIVILTNRNEEFSEIAAFEAGVDDFILKPFRKRAFIKRIQRLLTKPDYDSVSQQHTGVLAYPNLLIDRQQHIVIKDGVSITLPRKQFELLFLLAKSPDVLFSREDIFKNLWIGESNVTLRTIDVHIRKIRMVIGEDFITTVKGLGYKFIPPAKMLVKKA